MESSSVLTGIASIVLIDDEDDHHFITRLMLRKAQFQGSYVTFRSADEALVHLRTHGRTVDLLLIDINMPATSGFDMLRTCEEEGLLPNGRTMVVMCSSSNRPDDIQTARRFRSVDDYVEKSFTVEQFERLNAAFTHRST